MVWMTGRPGTTAGYDVVFPENNVHNSHHSHHTLSLPLLTPSPILLRLFST
jgi:hypothetical protein